MPSSPSWRIFTGGIMAAMLCAATPVDAPPGDDACTSVLPAAMGGSLATNKNVIVLRWLGTSNFELAFRGQVFLLDAYFDRGPRNRPTGIVPNQVHRTDAIFIGHGHFDHMSDAVPIALRTQSHVYGAPITIATAYRLGLPKELGISVGDGEVFTFPGLTVTAALAQHSTLQPEVLTTLGKLFD